MTTVAADTTRAVIREATAADVDALLRLLITLVTTSRYTDHARVNVEHISATLVQHIENPSICVLIAERDGVIVGVLLLALHPDLISGELTASELSWYVLPDYRDGSGLLLLDGGEEVARKRGATSIQMLSPEDRFNAAFRRRGYAMTSRVFERRL